MQFVRVYEKIKESFKNTTSSIVGFLKANKINLITLLFLFAANHTANSIRSEIHYNQSVNQAIDSFMEANDESTYLLVEGRSYETNEGMIDTYRVLSDQSAYRIYIENRMSEDIYVYNENDMTWEEKELAIFPSVAEAFIVHDIGLVDSLDNHIAVVDGEEYEVEYSLDKVDIEGYPTYRVIPPLPNRTVQFVEEYMGGVAIDKLEYIDRLQKEGYEEIYFRYGNKAYRILSHVNGRVNIARVQKLK